MSIKQRFQLIGFIAAVVFASNVVAEPIVMQGSELIAVVSGISPPHQGFALAVHSGTAAKCLRLGQDLSAEMGISVHVMCISQTDGVIAVAAECGFTDSKDSLVVGGYRHAAWKFAEAAYLKCVPSHNQHYEAIRIEPDIESLGRVSQQLIDAKTKR